MTNVALPDAVVVHGDGVHVLCVNRQLQTEINHVPCDVLAYILSDCMQSGTCVNTFKIDQNASTAHVMFHLMSVHQPAAHVPPSSFHNYRCFIVGHISFARLLPQSFKVICENKTEKAID